MPPTINSNVRLIQSNLRPVAKIYFLIELKMHSLHYVFSRAITIFKLKTISIWDFEVTWTWLHFTKKSNSTCKQVTFHGEEIQVNVNKQFVGIIKFELRDSSSTFVAYVVSTKSELMKQYVY